MITSSQNSSITLRKDASDILEQIKKKAEDISTSEGSIPFFQNLSNPTNLTNPQIISFRKIKSINNYKGESQERSTYVTNRKLKTRNVLKKIKKVKSEISILRDEFLISDQIKKILSKKEPKKEEQKEQKIETKKNFEKRKRNLHSLDKRNKKNKNKTIVSSINEGDIWVNLKKYKFPPKGDIRINKRKNVSVREYLSDTKEIQLMNYINRNKIERFMMLQNIKKTELDTINNTLYSLENSKEYINTNYREKYASYISYLNKERDKEEKKGFELFFKKEKLKNEIKQIQFRYNKIKKEKNFLINMNLLLIQIKEKMRKIPERAYLIFENRKKETTRTQRLTRRPKTIVNVSKNEDIEKLIKYKGKAIYNDISEFEYDFKQIEDIICNKFKQKGNLELEIEQLKQEYNQIKKEVEYDPYAEDKAELIKTLNKLKTKNKELKQEIISLKIKFSDEKHNILTKKKHGLKHSLSSLSLKTNSILGIDNNIKKNTGSYYFKNVNTYYDNYNTMYGFKNIYTLSNFNFNKMIDVSDLYMSCYQLYLTSKDNLFEKIEINFDVKKDMNSPKINEDIVIIKMLDYIDQVATLLIKQKNECFANSDLKKKYEKLKSLLEMDKKRLIFINNLKEEEKKQLLKVQQLELKMNKVNYIPKKNCDYQYYFRAQKELATKKKRLAEGQRPPTFEDFMHDILV